MTVTVFDHDADRWVEFDADHADEAREMAREWMAAGHTKGGEFTRPDARTEGLIRYTVTFGEHVETHDFDAGAAR